MYSGFSRIIEILSLIRGCRHNWSNHVKTCCPFYDNLFIFVFMNSYSRPSKLSQFITNGIGASKLKIFGRAKNYKTHDMKIKEVLVQGGVDYSLIKI